MGWGVVGGGVGEVETVGRIALIETGWVAVWHGTVVLCWAFRRIAWHVSHDSVARFT